MSTKKSTKNESPRGDISHDDLQRLRLRLKTTEDALAESESRLSDLLTRHSKLTAELARRASGLPILGDLVGVALRMHGKDTAGRTILVAIGKAIAEMRAFNGGDALPTDGAGATAQPMTGPGGYASAISEAMKSYGGGEPARS